MSRPRQRVCLEEGLKLNLNRLRRQGYVRDGVRAGPNLIRWAHNGEEIASALVTANMEGEYQGWVRIQIAGLDQWIGLVAQSRHFGGRQWYIEGPSTHRRCSVLWMPPGATRFCSRQTWRRQVAYASQFADPDNRAHIGQAKIKAQLIADLDPDAWDLPPKPKWMRWKTYNRYVERYDAYEAILDEGGVELMAKLLQHKFV